MIKPLKIFFLFLLIPSFAFAQEADTSYRALNPKEMSSLYSPEHCEFKIGFPTAPVIQEMCDGGESGTECYEQVMFTQTFGMDATVNVRVVCNKIGQDIKDKYNQDVMVATLEAMTQNKVLKTFETTYYDDDEKRYRLAGLVGEGKVGLIPSIFVAQMWLGQKSAFSIEAEIVGDAFSEPDSLFRDILSSVSYKDTQKAE